MTEFVQLPAGIGFLISLIVELAKLAGLKDGLGGKLSVALNIVVIALLTLLTDVFSLDLQGEQAAAITEVLSLIGQLGLAIVSGFVTHKTLRVSEVIKPRSQQ